jgi:uncharacterized protein YndB with AHSA1/START domain
MMSGRAERRPTARRELTITRVIDAPREAVFDAWTDPRQMAQWWGPNGFTNPVCEMDARPGGAIRLVMRAPDGVDYPMTGTFREIAKPRRLVYAAAAEDHDGNPPLKWVSTVTFAEDGGRTRLTVEESAGAVTPVGAQMLEGMEAGLRQTLDRLEAHVARSGDRPNGSRAFTANLSIHRQGGPS